MLIVLFVSIENVHAFSFNFGDDDYYNPYYAPAFNPWVAPPPPVYFYRPRPYFIPPQMNNYDSSTMVRKRQEVMDNHDTAMNRLFDMLYGDYGFDRAEAIKMARKIEVTSGSAITANFHPGAVVDFHSKTSSAFWGNEQTFNAHAQALKAAAEALAIELAKEPGPEEGAVVIPGRGINRDRDSENPDGVVVSPQIWEKFNHLSTTCEGCHDNFRGGRW
jgi:cytochrome c556